MLVMVGRGVCVNPFKCSAKAQTEPNVNVRQGVRGWKLGFTFILFVPVSCYAACIVHCRNRIVDRLRLAISRNTGNKH